MAENRFSFANIPLSWMIAGLVGLTLVCTTVAVISSLLFFSTLRDRRVAAQPSLPPPATQPATAVTEASPTAGPAATVTVVNVVDGRITAVRLHSAPAIDGNLAEWQEIPAFTTPHIVAQAASWNGTMDLTALWRVGWDERNLYLAVAVEDDIHVQIREPKFAYLGDSLELQFDTNIQADYGPRVSSDDYQYILSPGNFADLPPGVFRFRGNTEGVMVDFLGSQATVAAVKTAAGYNLEAAIPWSDLGLNPAAGLVIGAAFNVNDLDTPGTAVQELMLSHVPGRRWSDPTTWGTVELAP